MTRLSEWVPWEQGRWRLQTKTNIDNTGLRLTQTQRVSLQAGHHGLWLSLRTLWPGVNRWQSCEELSSCHALSWLFWSQSHYSPGSYSKGSLATQSSVSTWHSPELEEGISNVVWLQMYWTCMRGIFLVINWCGSAIYRHVCPGWIRKQLSKW